MNDKTYNELNEEFGAVEREISDLYAKLEELNQRRGELREALQAKKGRR